MLFSLYEFFLYNCLFLIFSFILFWKIAKTLRLVDKPNNRKKHIGDIPTIGGLIIISLVYFSFSYYTYNDEIYYIIYASTAVAFIGIIDDIKSLRPVFRIILQIFITITLIQTGIYIVDIGTEIFFFLDFSLSIFSFVLTIFCVLALTNAFNFIDGLDGLCIGISIMALLSILFYAYWDENRIDPFIIYILLLSLFFLLIFNFGFLNLKIFLGDTGSTFLGFFISWLLIYYSLPNIGSIHPILTIWCIAYPVFDTFNVVLLRLLNNKNIFNSDRFHLHYSLIDIGYSKKITLIIILTYAFFLNISGFMVYYYFSTEASLIFYFLNLISFVFFYRINIYSKKL